MLNNMHSKILLYLAHHWFAVTKYKMYKFNDIFKMLSTLNINSRTDTSADIHDTPEKSTIM